MGRAEIEGIVQALELLGQYGWHDSTSSLWLTEGAVATPDPAKLTVGEALEYERLQADLVRLNYELLCEVDEVRLWTYHTFHDLESEPAKTGLRQDFDWERQQPGAEKLAWDRFVELPGEVEFSLPDRVPAVAVPAA